MTDTKHMWANVAFGLSIDHVDGDECITELVQPGLRRNPRRAHLLVSTVLGKHIAVTPDTVLASGGRLGAAIASLVDGDTDVLGMAETATGLGHCVADHLDAAAYLHSTRRPPTRGTYAEFREGHSHATDHSLQPTSADFFGGSRPLVIVDDEISTGTTALAAIEALHQLSERSLYVVASLVDVRGAHHRETAEQVANRLGARIVFVSLTTGRVSHPPDLAETVCALDTPKLNIVTDRPAGSSKRLDLPWPSDVPEGGRHGVIRADRPGFSHASEAAAQKLASTLDMDRPVLVVGHEEFMYLPLRLAEGLRRRGADVRFQSTTRSPAYVSDRPGYPLREGYQFPASEPGEEAPRYLYNGWRGDDPAAGATQMLLVMDALAAEAPRTRGDIVDVLTASGYDVTVVVVPGPDADALARQRRHPE